MATPASMVATGITFETRRENTFKFIKDCSLRREMGPFPCKHIVSGRPVFPEEPRSLVRLSVKRAAYTGLSALQVTFMSLANDFPLLWVLML